MLVSEPRNPLTQFVRHYEAALWLALIMCVAVYLRFRGLTFQSYWFDELFSAYFSNPEHSFKTVLSLTLSDVHPPFYQLMMWLSYKIFGYTEWAGRLPSAVAGIATIPVIYLLGRDIFNSRTGLYAAALALPNFYLLYYAQEARSYAFLYFLCSLSFLFFIRALTSRSRLNLALYIASTLVLLYTHYFGFVLMAAQGIIAAAYLCITGWSNRPLLIRSAISTGTIFVAVVPLLPMIASHSAIDDFWIPQPESGFLTDYFYAYFNSGLVAGVILALVCAALLYSLRSGSSRQACFGVFALFIWIAIGYLLPWLRGLTGQPVLTDRNTIMLVPPLLILAAYGLSSLPWLWLQRVIGSALLAYSFYLLFFTPGYYEQIRKHQYREITQAMGTFEPSLPVYTLNFNKEKYNVYFLQQGSKLVAKDASELGSMLDNSDVPFLFWLAGGHRYSPKADLAERYGMIEVGRYSYKGTAAAMLLNPATATSLTLEVSDEDSDDTRVVYTSSLLSVHDTSLQLLVKIDEIDQAAGEIRIELLTEDGRIIRSEVVHSANVPATFLLESMYGVLRVKISLPDGKLNPIAWLIPAGG